jgi:asparagine synthase (glutamine-hydrolysing)
VCGIAGVYGRRDPDTVQAMLRSLVHRGPDDEHLVEGDRFTIGARRLSILDVDHGRQPITNENMTVWAALNGELYNYPDVRADLLRLGHTLTTRCDTELLPHLYEDVGPAFVRAIDGMFAIALWDERRGTGLLVRDRMGKKPIYYTQLGGALYFASEIKALLHVPGFERRLNTEALHHYLSLKHVPHPLSIFEGVRMIPPAHLLTYEVGANSLRLTRYWSATFAPDPHIAAAADDEIASEVLGRLRVAVRKRLLSDVPIGFLLSGGIDSSLSTALAAEESGGPIDTFCLTYSHDSTTPGKEQDRRWARWVADRFGTRHHEETVNFADFPDEFRRILRCFDEPFAGVVSTYLLSRLIGTHVKVALAGDGADELFGSYRAHRLAMPIANYAMYERTGDESLLRPFEHEPETIRALVGAEWEWRSTLFTFSEGEKSELYMSDLTDATRDRSTVDLLRHEATQLTATDPLNRILELEFRTVFPDQVLAFVDRLSMAHSLELRSAYLDTALVEYVARVPGVAKMRNGETKHLLKLAASRYFPHEMVHRQKEGFVMPVTTWLARDLEGYVRETLAPDRLSRHGLFRANAVATIVNDAYAAPEDYLRMNKVLTLIAFQEWYDLYLA